VIPFLGHRNSADLVAIRGNHTFCMADFVQDVFTVARALPQRSHLINLCTDRYRFAVGLAAAMVREQISLLPPAHTPELLRALRARYPGLYAVTDGIATDAVELISYPNERGSGRAGYDPLAFPASRVAAIAFTSGSTGEPTPHPKTWGGLALGAVGEAQRLGLRERPLVTLVGTVPPQHMYGLESTVLLALHNGLVLHAGRPFYPADIRAALQACPGERVLVTTPVHLRALLSEELTLPQLHSIVCATAPLAPAMAADAEARYGAPLHEVYGFTEAGMVATRRTTQGPEWTPLPGVTLRQDELGVWFSGGHIPEEVAATDVLEPHASQQFILHGRNADLVNVAGKRTSLAYLNQQLNGIEGVRDGAFFMPDEQAGAVTRLIAFVVAPELSREDLFAELRQRIDLAFLPRPLYLVDGLPRAATGKLPREALCRLAERLARARE